MAFWNEIGYKAKPVLMKLGKGINSYLDPSQLEMDELTDSLNMCADDYPILRSRNDRVLTSLAQLTGTLWGMGQRNTQYIHVLETDTWKYGLSTAAGWTNVSTVASPAKVNFIEFNTQTAKYTIMAYSTGTVYNAYWDGSTFMVFADTNSPRSNLYTAHKYRLYGIDYDGRTLRYSAQGTITDWTSANDAGYIDLTEIKGKAIAITTFQDHVIIWSDNSMHELYGSSPINHDLLNVSHNIGCVSRNAYAECKGKLFWMDYSGIYIYTGGMPRQLAYKAKKYIDGINWDYKELIHAAAVGEKIYFAIPYKSTTINRIIVIDIIEGKGNIHVINIEDGNWNRFVSINEQTFGLRSDGYIYDMHSTLKTGLDNSTAFSWSFETKPFAGEPNQKIALRDMFIEHNSTGVISSIGYTSNDDSTTYTALTISSITNTTYSQRFQVMPLYSQLQDNTYMKFQVAGTGQKAFKSILLNIVSYGDVI